MELLFRCERCGELVLLFRGDPWEVHVGPGGLFERIVVASDSHECSAHERIRSEVT